MARLQILELPEGAGDDRPPFILVIDQAPREEPLFRSFRENMDLNDFVADRVGARAVLVFEDAIEIPANEVSIGPDGYPVRLRVEADMSQFEEQLAGARAAAERLLPVQREVDQMDRITDALGFDRLRNWDEIVWAIEDARNTKRDGSLERS